MSFKTRFSLFLGMMSKSEKHPIKSALAESIFLAMGVLFVLLVFQPFGTDDFDDPYKYEQLLGYGVLVLISYPLIKWMIQRLLVKTVSSWTLQWISVLTSGFLLLVPCFVYYSFVIMGRFVWSWLPSFAMFSFAIGIPFVLLIIYDKWLKEKARKKSGVQATNEESISLTGDNKDETYVFRTDTLLYLQSEGNYVKVVFLDNDKVSQVLVRSTLSKLSSQLSTGDFMQTHRSFLVGKKHFTRMTQQDGKYSLGSSWVSDSVPVSKTFVTEVKRKLKNFS